MFSRSDLDELVAAEAQPAASLYLPTHVAGREIRQDPIRLKNLLSSAADGLAASRRKPDIDSLLAPAEALVADDDFWRHQEPGLALFLAPGFSRIYKLPLPVREEVTLGAHFHIRPLLPLFEDAGAFWLLTISAKHTRAYRGSRWSCAEVTDIDLPQGVGPIRGMTDYQETQYASPVGRRGTLAHAQSFGEAPDELRKTELIEFLHRVAAAFEPHLKRNPAPLVLAAHPEIQGNFREIAGWKEILPEGILENPDALHRGRTPPARLCARRTESGRRPQGRTRSPQCSAAGGKASTKPEDIVKAARYARIDALFLSGDEHLWGRFDETEDRVLAHGSKGDGDVDLLDYAALMTLRQGGSVMLVDRAMLPPPGIAAAILRY